MTENKRFTKVSNNGYWSILDNQADYENIFDLTNPVLIVDRLNELADENEMLKSENEILKRKLKTYHSGNQTIHQTLTEIRKENQEIKNIIKEAYTNERTAIGKSVLKQLLNNIGEI